MIGRTLSHYRIEERLGAGGMGEVYRARDEKLGRDVALKVLPSGALADEESRRRFRKEAAVLSRLSHPHIATLLDFDSADGIDFLVMELVTGPTLEQELRKGPLPEKDVVRLGSQLARALVAAHEQGVIHRDLKPSNLQLTSDGMLKILDFGVAYLEPRREPTGGEATATETAAGEILGSPPYMAPEQVLGKGVDARTDLYAAGACLYELATGRLPAAKCIAAPNTGAPVPAAPAGCLRPVLPGCLGRGGRQTTGRHGTPAPDRHSPGAPGPGRLARSAPRPGPRGPGRSSNRAAPWDRQEAGERGGPACG